MSCSEEESFGITDISDDEIQVVDYDEGSRGGGQVRIGGKPFEISRQRDEQVLPGNMQSVMYNAQTEEPAAQITEQGPPRQPEMGLDLSQKSHSVDNNKDKENNEAEAKKEVIFQRFLQRAKEVEKSKSTAHANSPNVTPRSAPSAARPPANQPPSLFPTPPVSALPLRLDLGYSGPDLPQVRVGPLPVSRTQPAIPQAMPSTSGSISKEIGGNKSAAGKGISSKTNGSTSSKRVDTSISNSTKKTVAPAPVLNPRVAIPLAPLNTLPSPVVEDQNFSRVVIALQERQAKQEECLTISPTAPGRLVAFDKNKEGRRRGEEMEVKQVAAYIKEEFHQFGRSGGDGAEGLQVSFNFPWS